MNIYNTIFRMLKGETLEMSWSDHEQLSDYINNEASNEVYNIFKNMASIDTTIGTIRTLKTFLREPIKS